MTDLPRHMQSPLWRNDFRVVGTITGRLPAPAPRSLPPLEQHKADLEMIMAACVTGADMTGEAACASIAKLANAMLLRLDSQHVVTDGDQS